MPGTADAAAAVVADAVAIALEAEAVAAAEQVLATAAAIAVAAETAAAAAARARGARAVAVEEAARIVSHDSARTAVALAQRAEANAAFFAGEMRQVMDAIASRDAGDGDSSSTLLAMRLIATLRSVADASARDTESAAVLAAHAVAAAAAHLAVAESAVDLGVETEVSDAADALRHLNVEAARRSAETTHARAAGAALAAQEAAAAMRVEQLHHPDSTGEDLVATASHELRAPLAGISANAEMLQKEDGLTAAQTGFVDAIVRNAARLDALTGDLLLLPGISSTAAQRATSEVDLRAVVSSVEEVIRTLGSQRGVTVVVELPSEPVLVTGVAGQLEQVATNVMSNAIKFTGDGGTVVCRLSSTPTDVRMVVVDTGIGIPEAEQEHLFDRFYRGSGAREGAIRGTGLGLHIAATIVSSHGGDIAVDSVAGQGSVFTVRLPRRLPVPAEG